MSSPQPARPLSTRGVPSPSQPSAPPPEHKRQLDLKSVGTFVEKLGDVVLHIVHVPEALIGKTLSSVPEKPVQAIGFTAVLLLVVLYMGVRYEKTQSLCFACIAGLTLIALGLIFVILKNPPDNPRLAAMQDQRMDAVQVRPIQYDSRSNQTHDDENPRD